MASGTLRGPMSRSSPLTSPRIRLLLSGATFALGVHQVLSGVGWGVVWFVVSALAAYAYFRYDAVGEAFRHVAGGRMDDAAALLAGVKRPERLSSVDRAYFELASGLVSASRAENERAEQHLERALAHRLRTDNDRALAEAVLSQLLAARDAHEEARLLIARAATRDCRPGIAERIQAIQRELESPAAPPAGSS